MNVILSSGEKAIVQLSKIQISEAPIIFVETLKIQADEIKKINHTEERKLPCSFLIGT